MAYGTIKVDNITFDNGGSDQNVTVSGLYNSLTSGVTVTGTISGSVVIGGTSVSGTTVLGTTVTGTTVQGVSGTFTSLTGTTTTGTTANFASGVFTSLTGATATFTSGIIASGTASNPSLSIIGDGNTGIYSPGVDQLAIATNGSIQLTVNSSGQVALNSLGSAAVPAYSWIGDPNTGFYRPNADEIAIATNGTTRLTTSNSAISSTLPIDVPLGAAGTPSFTFTGDPNTGIFSPGADQVSITTNGTERLRVDAVGQIESVSLGTAAAPAYSFTTDPNTGIFSPGADQVAISTNGTGRLTVGTTAVSSTLAVDHPLGAVGTPSITFTGDLNTGFWSPSADAIAASTGGSERLRIDSSGRLGLGTSSPAYLAEIVGGSSATRTALLQIRSNFNAANTGSTLRLINSTSATGTVGAEITALRTTDGGSSDLLFVNSNVERLRITQTGNVGIGTTAPLDQLSVAGGGFSFAETGGAARNIIWKNSTDNVGSVFIRGDAANGTLAFNTNTVANAGSERARIDSSGRLLVGTSTAAVGWGNLQSHTTSANAGICLNFANDNTPAIWSLGKSRGSLADTTVIVQANDALGSLRFVGTDGTGNLIRAAQINCEVDNTPGANDMPGRLVFSVTADGASSPTEALRISNNRAITVSDGGNVVLGTTTGTKIGTATTQKLGFYNATPVVQPTAVADATTAIDVITQLNDLLAKLRTLGIIAT